MNTINLLNETTYELLNENGEQVKQAPITEEMIAAAKAKRWSLRRYIADLEKVRVEKPLSVQVEGQEVVVVPPHDHDFDDRYAEAEHAHDYAASDHEHPHNHADLFNPIHEAILAASQMRYDADEAIKRLLKEHSHPEYAQAFHTHDDIYASLNILRGMVTAVEGLIPTEVQPHQHNDVYEAIALLRSEVASLRGVASSLESKIDSSIASLKEYVGQQIAEAAPKGDYATKAELEELTNRKARYAEIRRSEENTGGKEIVILTLERLP